MNHLIKELLDGLTIQQPISTKTPTKQFFASDLVTQVLVKRKLANRTAALAFCTDLMLKGLLLRLDGETKGLR
jgi:hypothetical protein